MEAPRIHPSATVHPSAVIAADARIGPRVAIEHDVEIGEGSEVLAGTILHPGTRVGARCRLGPYAVIGGPPIDYDFGGEISYVVLEDEVMVREFSTIHRATGAMCETRIGRGSLVMCYVHISHNATIGERCVVTNHCQLAGHCTVGDRAVLSASVLIHQFVRVGSYAMLSGGSAAVQDILPFSTAKGNPARHYRLNRVGLERGGIAGERYRHIENGLRAVRRKDFAQLEGLGKQSKDVQHLADFFHSTERGVARFVT